MKSASPRLPGFEEAFNVESRRLFVERSRFLLWSALSLYPTFWFLDLLVAPEEAMPFLAIRAGVCGVYLLGLAAVYSRFAERLAQPLVMTGAVASAVGISLMAAQLGGFESHYFAGVVIVIFVIGVFIPWELPAAAALCALILLSYTGINLADHGPSPAMIAPLFFLAGASVFTWLACLSNRRIRRRDLSLRLRLEKANEELKELDEAKTRFFANVSHELRTPLTLMLGPLETLLAADDDGDRRVLLEAMATNSRRLLRQVNALLDGAKLESGRLRLEPAPGNLGKLLAELTAAAAPHAERRGIRLLTERLDEVPDSSFDPHKAEVVAANLLSNALKFTPPAGCVTVRAEAGRDFVAFEVEDDGPGIPAGELERIFERFHQVDGSASREFGGTGLGLALARELARLHGGNVSVRSRPGEGSVFRVELPRDVRGAAFERRRQPRRREDQLVQARTDALAAREYALRTLRDTLLADVELPRTVREATVRSPAGAPLVLVVEDNEDLRGFLASRLSHRYRVETAADGAAGLAAADRCRPDLIVTDAMMPGVDGFELCRRLKADPAFASTPVILLTARAGTEAVAEGLDAGADDYVVKPFALRELEARIAAHLRAREIERQLRERESRLAAIGQMTSAVVHDLRNPLTLVKGYADLAHALAVRGGDAATIARELEMVRSESDRLRRMIEEILDFARGGSPRLDLQTVPAARFLEDALQPLADDLRERGIEADLDLRLDAALQVNIDRDRIQRVLENLVTNAREALACWGLQRRVAIRVGAEGDLLAVRVADSGPGIPEDAAGHLFEPFTTGKKQGTGLGLVTVRNLVRAHGGDVRVETRAPEGGAAFTVLLPLAERVKPRTRALKAAS
ncbi:MAG TPA: ATP-binding protein [Thermoanaerobaculia bacterium]